MNVRLITKESYAPAQGNNAIYLSVDHWNDFSYITMFALSLHDAKGVLHQIGHVKIGFKGQKDSQPTYGQFPENFSDLPDGYFSLGTDIDYYAHLYQLPQGLREEVLTSLNDMVFDSRYIDLAQGEDVFSTSLLRDVSLSMIKGQYRRVLEGQPPLTDFEFIYSRPAGEKMAGIELAFDVEHDAIPRTNIHSIIGRNGIGKTTVLNGMINAITKRNSSAGKFLKRSFFAKKSPIDEDFFSSLVSVSFSAFDPFTPPQEQSDPSKGTCYFYIGLKDKKDPETLLTIPELHTECAHALVTCFRQKDKKERWLKAIELLGSDDNFSDMNLENLESRYSELTNRMLNVQVDSQNFLGAYNELIKKYLMNMSSGHFIVLLTVSKLVATVEEKTLVLIDEPESHLHPPLLSTFIRSLSELLYDRNGVAIIATHSPVVLQELPKSCIWKIYRSRLEMGKSRPENETFGENVGMLTREVFGLEVTKSGFHKLLEDSVKKGDSYDDILHEYNHQLGFEARALLKALVLHRDKGELL
ncbi:MAG: putative ATPase [Candidatus Endobugula sp.]|jgi:predicted ATPase